MSKRLTTLKTVLWALVGVLVSVTIIRFAHGLGAVTNLSDAAPWGLWIGFDVMSGVALAAGGFVLAGIVYIFGLERYRPFVRAAILTALLGYAAVAVGLLYGASVVLAIPAYLQDVVPSGPGFTTVGGTQANRIRKNGYPNVYNIEQDPREEFEIGPEASWVVGKYMPYVLKYYASLRKHPNPKPATITDFSER